MTLAHELGHGIHQTLADKNGYLMAQTPLTLAETASVFGEQLTMRSTLGLILIIVAVTIVVAGGGITKHLVRFRKLFPRIIKKVKR